MASEIGSGAAMPRPLEIAVLLALVATPAVYYVLLRTLGGAPRASRCRR